MVQDQRKSIYGHPMQWEWGQRSICNKGHMGVGTRKENKFTQVNMPIYACIHVRTCMCITDVYFPLDFVITASNGALMKEAHSSQRHHFTGYSNCVNSGWLTQQTFSVRRFLSEPHIRYSSFTIIHSVFQWNTCIMYACVHLASKSWKKEFNFFLVSFMEFQSDVVLLPLSTGWWHKLG